MMTSASDTRQLPQPRGPSRQSKWYRLYFVLAAFDILTVCISLAVSHRLMGMYESSIEIYRVSASRVAAYAHLNSLAGQANAPGNDVFESRDANDASARLDATVPEFFDALVDARQELRQNLAADTAADLLTHLDHAEEAMREQVTEARSLFAFVRAHDMKSAGERMAAMDHAFHDVTEALALLGRDVHAFQQKELENQASAATSMRRGEYFIAAIIAIMVSLAAWYGYRMIKNANIDERLRDLTREAQEHAVRAEAADHAKSEFLANMSHEIRTPMTAILGFAENLLEADQSEAENLNAIHTIRRNGEYLLDLINDILDLSKIEAGKMAVERGDCQPCHVIAEVASLMRVRADAKGLPFNIEYIGPIPETIRTDTTRLRQILINLLGNAIKFTEVGTVRLVTRCMDDGNDPYLQCDVIDTGRGMTEEQVAKLFQPFMQADSSTTREFGGTGLGLTISKRFAMLLDGDICVAVTEIGVGTTFRVTVATGPLDGVKRLDDPISATVVTDAGSAVAQVARSDLHGLRVLLAEDGPDNQRLISHVVKKAGAEITVAENGKIALDAALAARDEGNAFDVILMDIQMPVMDGYEATGLLRRKGYTGAIIALTAHAMDGDRDKCIKAGCNDYTTKPIDRKKLIEMVRVHAAKPETATIDSPGLCASPVV